MHIALILDGNRRWARNSGLPAAFGHKKGIENFENITRYIRKRRDIAHASAFALSTENLQRSEKELKNLFQIFKRYAQKNIPEFQEKGIRARFFGNIDLLPESLQKAFLHMEKETKNGNALGLNICVAYGGRDEIVRAAEKLHLSDKEWTEDNLTKHLDSSPAPDVDLLIRTGGKSRISNFMLWKLAYAELYFSEKMWPEFSEADLGEAVSFYQDQKRTFGK